MSAAATVRSDDPVEIAELPLAQRRLAASGSFGPAPRVLLEDPICAIRVDALRHLDEARRTPALLTWLREDSCRWVRLAARDVQGGSDEPGAQAFDVDLPACDTSSQGGFEVRIHLGNEGQYYGEWEQDGAFDVRCNWCGARDYSYADAILERFRADHRCDVVPLDREHLEGLADRIDQEVGSSRYVLAVRQGHRARIDTQWLIVGRRAETAPRVAHSEFRSLLSLLAAESERNRWTLGLIFTPKVAAQVQDLMLDYGFSPHDPRTGDRYSRTGQIYLHRPTPLTSMSKPALKAPPPAMDDES